MTGKTLSRRADGSDCDVLIVGAGPTGLVLACELLARGIGVRVIDKSGGAAGQTRALAVHARALEVLDMMGLAGARGPAASPEDLLHYLHRTFGTTGQPA